MKPVDKRIYTEPGEWIHPEWKDILEKTCKYRRWWVMHVREVYEKPFKRALHKNW